MSSPIAKPDAEKNLAHKSINALHQKLSHGRRIETLSNHLIRYVREVTGDRKEVRCLDVGCGDLGILERIQNAIPETVWQGLDIYDLPGHLAGDPKWKCYRKFNGRDFPFQDQSVDIVLFCDMLHHANESIPYLMKEAHRVGKTVIIKDSFEYSLYSRLMLKAMDFVGNWGYGVPLPEKYFTIHSFKDLCRRSGFEIKKMDIGVQLYSHLPVLRDILRPEWHFFAVLEAQASPSS